MKCIEKLVNEIYISCKIPFQLIINEVGEFSTPEFDLVQDCIEKHFCYNSTECCIKINAALSVTIDLLQFCIEEKLKDVYLDRNRIISLLLTGKEVESGVIKASWPVITKEFNLINIYVDNYSDELLSYIKQVYLDSDIEILFYNGSILMIGCFEEVLHHAQSIKDTIGSIVSGKCYISYCEVDNYFKLKKYYEDTLYKIELSIKYNII